MVRLCLEPGPLGRARPAKQLRPLRPLRSCPPPVATHWHMQHWSVPALRQHTARPDAAATPSSPPPWHVAATHVLSRAARGPAELEALATQAGTSPEDLLCNLLREATAAGATHSPPRGPRHKPPPHLKFRTRGSSVSALAGRNRGGAPESHSPTPG